MANLIYFNLVLTPGAMGLIWIMICERSVRFVSYFIYLFHFIYHISSRGLCWQSFSVSRWAATLFSRHHQAFLYGTECCLLRIGDHNNRYPERPANESYLHASEGFEFGLWRASRVESRSQRMAALHCEVSLRTDCVRFSLVDIPIYGIYIFYILQTASQGRDHLQTACHAAVCQFRSDCRHDRVPGDCSGRWFEKFHYNGSPAVLRALPVVCLLLVRQRGLRAGDTNNKHLNHAFISLISLIYVEQNSFHLRVRLRLAQFRCEMQENSLDTHDKCGTSFPFYRRRIYGINSAEFHIYYQQIILDCSCAQTNV